MCAVLAGSGGLNHACRLLQVHNITGVEYLYSMMDMNQLEIPAFITEYDMTVCPGRVRSALTISFGIGKSGWQKALYGNNFPLFTCYFTMNSSLSHTE